MDTLSLNRFWKFRLDPKNVGLSEDWHTNTQALESGSIDQWQSSRLSRRRLHAI